MSKAIKQLNIGVAQFDADEWDATLAGAALLVLFPPHITTNAVTSQLSNSHTSFYRQNGHSQFSTRVLIPKLTAY